MTTHSWRSMIYKRNTNSIFSLMGIVSAVSLLTLGFRIMTLTQNHESFIVDLKETRLGVTPPSDWARVISFGQAESASLIDWLKIITQTDLIFPSEPGKISITGSHLITQSELNPWFYPIYVDGSHLLILLADDGLGAEILLKKGIAQTALVPEKAQSWKRKHWIPEEKLWLLLLYTQAFETGDFDGAALAAQEIIKNPRLRPWYIALERRLKTTDGRFEIAIRVQEDLIRRYQDDESLKKKAKAQLQDLMTAFNYYKNNQLIPENLKIPKGLRKTL